MTTKESVELECVLVASVFENPTIKPGPNMSTALAYAPDYWDSVEAGIVAGGIREATKRGRPTHRKVVEFILNPLYRGWLNHPMFKEGLPLSCIEPEAMKLVRRYHCKRIVATIQKAAEALIDHPEKARQVGMDLKLKLEGIL